LEKYGKFNLEFEFDIILTFESNSFMKMKKLNALVLIAKVESSKVGIRCTRTLCLPLPK
jgi:hypothetical protein